MRRAGILVSGCFLGWIFLAPAACLPIPGVTILAPEEGAITPSSLVQFEAVFQNVTTDPPEALLTLNGTEITGEGTFQVGSATVRIADFELSPAGVRFTAFHLPIAEELHFEVTVTEGRSASDAVSFLASAERGLYLGSGKDGDVTIDEAGVVINAYTHLVGNADAGTSAIVVEDASGFEDGDEILILQSAAPETEIGFFAFHQGIEVSANTITLDRPLDHTFLSDRLDGNDPRITQVIKVPNYHTLTVTQFGSITGKAWDGRSGGVVAFRVQETLTVERNGLIAASAIGYRGGAAIPEQGKGRQGESFAHPGGLQGIDPNDGGGGGGEAGRECCDAAGGGGGGFGTPGEDGHSASSEKGGLAGLTYGTPTIERLRLGSGGGSGAADFNETGGASAPGGSGGGILLLTAHTIAASGTIAADGGSGGAATHTGGLELGGGGGGSGGTILLSAIDIDLSALTAQGGRGSDGVLDFAPSPDRRGGDGGMGRIRIDYASFNGEPFPDAGEGEGGITTTVPPAFGAPLPE